MKQINTLNDCMNFEQVVELINENEGSCASKIAGAYAQNAVLTSDFPELTESNLEAHLDILLAAGATFNYRDALAAALIK